jgi:hypothetical protein
MVKTIRLTFSYFVWDDIYFASDCYVPDILQQLSGTAFQLLQFGSPVV